MKGFVTEHRGWDAYVSGTISIAILKHLLPDHIKADDAASEMHRCGFLLGPSTWADPCFVAFFQGPSPPGGILAQLARPPRATAHTGRDCGGHHGDAGGAEGPREAVGGPTDPVAAVGAPGSKLAPVW